MQVNLGSVNDNHVFVRRKNSSDGQKFDSASMPNFGKKSSADIMKEYIYKTDKKLDYFEKMNFLKGEAGTVIVTAIGTGCVAPIMIAFNPFAKAKPNATEKEKEENENMKKYTALRQPISALLSIAIQLSVLKPIDKMLESYVNKPSRSRWMFKNIDMATLPQDSYIGKHLLTEEDKVNYVIKELLEDEDTEKYIKANTAGKSEAEIDKFKNDFNAKSEAERNKEVAKWKINSENLEKEWKKDKYKKVAKWKSSNVYQKEVARLMLADKENRLMVNPGSVKPEDTTEYLKTLTADKPDAEKTKIENEFNAKSNELQQKEIIDWKIKTGKVKDLIFADKEVMNGVADDLLDEYLEIVNGDSEEGVKGLKYNERGRSFYKERAKILTDNEKHLRAIFDEAIIDEKVNADKSGAKLIEYLEELKSKETNNDIKTLIQEIIDREDVNIMQSRCRRTLDRIQYVKDCCGGTYNMEKYSEFIDGHERILDNLERKLQELKSDKNKDIPTVINKMEEIFKEVIDQAASTKDKKGYDSILMTLNIGDKGKLKEKIAKDIVKKYKKFVEDSYKGMNTWTKMLVGIFITIPLTCTALNWVYPRIMDKLFPELAGKKKAKDAKKAQGGQKCQ